MNPVLRISSWCRAVMSAAPLGLMLGSDEEPHRSATVVLGVRGFKAGRRLRLSGPGIRDPRLFEVDGLGEDIVAARVALTERFPRGVDLILTAGRELAAIPRTTKLEL
jgi:alpha-D-ribose 1-methylphosphonate 5-triphosphate synthase subunit PhnH